VAKGRKTRLSEEDKERAHEKWMKGLDSLVSLGKVAFICTAFVASMYVGVALPIKYSAGTTTIISYGLQWAQALKVDVLLAWGTAATCAGWAWSERKKRLRERKERDDRLVKLEQSKDPNRTSSGLTVDGRIARATENE
jgi:hypothetical protein